MYILVCSDGSYYVGQTSDVEKRIIEHNEGQGAAFTAERRPVKLVFTESFPTRGTAVKRELQLKKWTRAKKQALVDGNMEQLKQLSKSR